MKAMHRDIKTGKVVSKPEVGKIYSPAGPFHKTSVAIRNEKEKDTKEYFL